MEESQFNNEIDPFKLIETQQNLILGPDLRIRFCFLNFNVTGDYIDGVTFLKPSRYCLETTSFDQVGLRSEGLIKIKLDKLIICYSW